MNQFMENNIEEVCSKYYYDETNLLPILLELQTKTKDNHISEQAARKVAKKLGITEGRVYEVVTYYAALSQEPRGEHIIQICESTSCSVSGNKELISWFEDELGIKMGETTGDKKFSLIYTHCFGACDVAPAVRIGHEVHGNLTRDKVKDIIAKRRG